jgi:hypothetical protein
MPALASLPAYLDLLQVIGLNKSIQKHLKVRAGGQGWTDTQMVLALVVLNLAGGDCVEDIQKVKWLSLYSIPLSQRLDSPLLGIVVLPVSGNHRVVIRAFMRIHVSSIAFLPKRVRIFTQGRQDPCLRGVILPVSGNHRVVIRAFMRIQISSIAFLLDGIRSL